MKSGSIFVCLVFVLLAVPLVLAADGDPISISSQSPPNDYTVSEEDSLITLAFMFTGDLANCSFYGNWSGGWEEKMILENRTPGSYDLDIATVLFDCNEAYLWNVFCVEDNNSANFNWGENRTFIYDCPKPPEQEPPPGKSYSVILSNPWEGELYLNDRWLFEIDEDKFSLIVTNITVDSVTLMLTPSHHNFTISFLGSVDIDADGNETKDLTVKMKRLFAEWKVLLLLSEYGYEEPSVNDTINETINLTINETINDTISNTTDQNMTNITGFNETINITNQTVGNGTENITTNENVSVQPSPPEPQNNEGPKDGLPLWIILLIMMVIVIIVVYFAFHMLGPTMV